MAYLLKKSLSGADILAEDGSAEKDVGTVRRKYRARHGNCERELARGKSWTLVR